MFERFRRKADIIPVVCALPEVYATHRWSSPIMVARRYRLKQRRDQVTLAKIIAYLSDNPDLVELWLRWTEDKRYSPAWGFSLKGEEWVVAYYPDGPVYTFNDPIQACAKFVEVELDHIIAAVGRS